VVSAFLAIDVLFICKKEKEKEKEKERTVVFRTSVNRVSFPAVPVSIR
jgi:hypothetical protein